LDLKCTITITGSTDSDQLGLNINFDPPLTEKDDVCCAFSGELIKRIGELMPKKEDDDDEQREDT